MQQLTVQFLYQALFEGPFGRIGKVYGVAKMSKAFDWDCLVDLVLSVLLALVENDFVFHGFL